MAVQRATTITNKPFILDGTGEMRRVTVAQDGARSGDMAIYTVMAYDPTNENWVPLTDVAATDGTQHPRGILMQTLAEADIQAGDIEDVAMLLGECYVDEDQVVLENSLTLASIIIVPTNYDVCVRDALRTNCNLKLIETIDTTEVP